MPPGRRSITLSPLTAAALIVCRPGAGSLNRSRAGVRRAIAA